MDLREDSVRVVTSRAGQQGERGQVRDAAGDSWCDRAPSRMSAVSPGVPGPLRSLFRMTLFA